MIMTVIFTIVCIINNIYYNYYKSFASFSILANIAFAGDVSNAIFEKVLKVTDLIYIWCPISLNIKYNSYLYKKFNIR